MGVTSLDELVRDKYSANTGLPGIDLVVLIKIVVIQYLFGIRFMCQDIKEIEMNVAYRWFIGYDFTQPIPHFILQKKLCTAVPRYRIIRVHFRPNFRGSCSLRVCVARGCIFDATHVKASANKNKYVKELVEEQSKKYQNSWKRESMRIEFVMERSRLEKSLSLLSKEVKASTTNPESGLFVKGEKERYMPILYIRHVTEMALFWAQRLPLEMYMTAKCLKRFCSRSKNPLEIRQL